MRAMTFVLACALWGAMLVWWFWDYVHAVLHKQPSETFLKALERGGRERTLNQAAQGAMLGGRLVTGLSTLTSAVLTVMTALWLLEGRVLGFLCGTYLAAGLVLGLRINFKAHRSWARLNVVNRLSLRWTHAWVWPMHLLTISSQDTKARRD